MLHEEVTKIFPTKKRARHLAKVRIVKPIVQRAKSRDGLMSPVLAGRYGKAATRRRKQKKEAHHSPSLVKLQQKHLVKWLRPLTELSKKVGTCIFLLRRALGFEVEMNLEEGSVPKIKNGDY